VNAAFVSMARDVVVARGPDARSFLQALVSQDLEPLAPGDGAHSLLLTPQGKLVADFRALVIADDELWCDCEPAVGRPLIDALTRFKIRVKVELERMTVTGVALRGDDVEAVLTAAGAVPPPAPPHAHVAWPEVEARVVRSDWPGGGLDLLVGDERADAVGTALASAGATRWSVDDYETARIVAGVVREPDDIDETTIAQEAELERDAVSFTKGCFLGQELVCRIDSRGHVNRFVRRLVYDTGAIAPAVGARVTAANGREVGTVSSVAPHAPVALATIRREVEPGETVTVQGLTAVVHPLRGDDAPGTSGA
jgi:folate-binding protein YgfZ